MRSENAKGYKISSGDFYGFTKQLKIAIHHSKIIPRIETVSNCDNL